MLWRLSICFLLSGAMLAIECEPWTAALPILAAGCIFIDRYKKRAPKRTGLDASLFPWTKSDFLTVRNLLAGGLHAFGRTDGGKTSSLKQVARAILRHGNSSLLVLCAKRDEYRDWLTLAKQAKREKDVVVIDAESPSRFNMVGYEAARKGLGAGIAANVTRFIMELRSVVFRDQESGGGDSQYWRKQDERLLLHAVTILQQANQSITPASLHRLIMSAPDSGERMLDEKWQADYCNRCIAEAFDRTKSEIEQHDFMLATDYFLKEWPCLADRTRASILAGTMATLSVMNTGIARELFANQTNLTPAEAIEGRKIVIVNMPPDEWGDVGIIANIGWKYHYQAEILRRAVSEKSPIAGIWGDESSLWVTSGDAHFLSRCRSYRGFMVYVCQSLNAYKHTLPGEKADAGIESMLANFSHKAFFALGDYATAEWAANLCGKELQQFTGGGVQHAPHQAFSIGREAGQHNTSFHEQFEWLMRPEEFMNGLRTGSPVNSYLVDCILMRSGVPFSNGLPVLDVTFDQRK